MKINSNTDCCVFGGKFWHTIFIKTLDATLKLTMLQCPIIVPYLLVMSKCKEKAALWFVALFEKKF